MRFIQPIKSALGRLVTPLKRSAFQAASMSRLTADWAMSILSADAATRHSLRQLRARSRDLERNGGIIERWLSGLEANVIGADGIGLQMKIKDPPDRSGVEKLDTFANNLIEREWKAFGKKGKCDVTRGHSVHSLHRTILRSAARDGDQFIRILRGSTWGRCGIAFQLIEADYIDEQHNVTLPNGNEIRMGVELDQWKCKVAYWVLTKHPGDNYEGVYFYDGKRMRIPANEVIHVARTKRAEETRAIPWSASIMQEIKMLEGYDEAELVAARSAACKMAVWERDTPEGYDGDGVDANGSPISEMEPGAIEVAPMGWKFKGVDPQHPTQAYPAFVKARLRKIAGALGISYHSLANDLEGVNYSSIRAGVLDEREMYKMTQVWFIEDVVIPMFEAWLEMALISGAIPLPVAKFEKFNQPTWRPRRWGWVDPLKDVQATKEAINFGLKTRTRALADYGDDFEEVMAELQYEEEVIKESGLKFEDKNGNQPYQNQPQDPVQLTPEEE